MWKARSQDCQHDYGHTSANTEEGIQDADADKNMTPQAKFRSFIDQSCQARRSIYNANFDRQTLGQTGMHFSPIGGYHRQKDLVLIMDVAL